MQLSLLSDEPSPLDTDLASVLPGVHERLVAITNEVQTSVTKSADNFTKMMHELKGMRDEFTEKNRLMGELHVLMAARLMGMETKQGSESRGANFSRLLDDSTELHPEPMPEPAPSRHYMEPRHQSLHTIYYEWWGLESYKNVPIPGGIAMMEANKKKWRRHFSGAETKHFSRIRMIVKGIDAQAEATGKDAGDILDEWDLLFRIEAKKSISKMATLIQRMGLVDKKGSRGRTKKPAQHQNI